MYVGLHLQTFFSFYRFCNCHRIRGPGIFPSANTLPLLHPMTINAGWAASIFWKLIILYWHLFNLTAVVIMRSPKTQESGLVKRGCEDFHFVSLKVSWVLPSTIYSYPIQFMSTSTIMGLYSHKPNVEFQTKFTGYFTGKNIN